MGAVLMGENSCIAKKMRLHEFAADRMRKSMAVRAAARKCDERPAFAKSAAQFQRPIDSGRKAWCRRHGYACIAMLDGHHQAERLQPRFFPSRQQIPAQRAANFAGAAVNRNSFRHFVSCPAGGADNIRYFHEANSRQTPRPMTDSNVAKPWLLSANIVLSRCRSVDGFAKLSRRQSNAALWPLSAEFKRH